MDGPTVVQLAALDDTGDSTHRVRWPAQALATQAPDWRVINLDGRAAERHDWAERADLLVAVQSSDPDLWPVIARRRRACRPTLGAGRGRLGRPAGVERLRDLPPRSRRPDRPLARPGRPARAQGVRPLP